MIKLFLHSTKANINLTAQEKIENNTVMRHMAKRSPAVKKALDVFRKSREKNWHMTAAFKGWNQWG